MTSQLVILDPAHFHASLLQREMYPNVSSRVSVFAPLGPEVIDYLNRVALFNSRKDDPTRWELDVHLSPDPLERMLREKPGNIVVLTGRNRGKIDRILASLSAGMHVLADKPWIISSADMPKLEEALEIAARKHLVAYDIMTERYEVTSELQRAFVRDADVFGSLESVNARSVHNVMKVVAGLPLRRPAWFFNIEEYGEGLADVGTHVVDLVQWTAFADQPIDYHRDLRITGARRWPLALTREQFTQVTGEPAFPSWVHGGKLDYFCNNEVEYTIRNAPVKLEITWEWQAPEGAGDVYEASFRGSLAHIEIRQGQAERYIPQLYIAPAKPEFRDRVFEAAKRRTSALAAPFPGVELASSGGGWRLTIPEQFRVGHEAHFAQVTHRFFDYAVNPGSMPTWERPNMLAKYFISTKGVEWR